MDNSMIGLATVIIALIAGSAVSRIHGGKNPIGDRVFLGLLSIPFIVIFVNSIDKNLNPWAKFLPTIPVIIYSSLLAYKDWHSNFTKIIYISNILVIIAFITYIIFR